MEGAYDESLEIWGRGAGEPTLTIELIKRDRSITNAVPTRRTPELPAFF